VTKSRPEPRGIAVNPTRYGTRKAKIHAQSEANRLHRLVYLQLDSSLTLGTYALVTVDTIYLPNHPFFTYYPEIGALESDSGRSHSGQETHSGLERGDT
jgi:hypothetical protein